jgi:uncharacterized protein YndB with AHSA1/START domain
MSNERKNNDAQVLRMTRTLNAPVALVWQVITQPEHLKAWYFDFGAHWALVPGVQFEWWGEAPNGKKWLHKGEMLEVIANKKLSHTWAYPGYTGSSTLTWELRAIDDTHTELTLTHEFTIPFDPTEEALRTANFEAGWNHIVHTALVEYLQQIA